MFGTGPVKDAIEVVVGACFDTRVGIDRYLRSRDSHSPEDCTHHRIYSLALRTLRRTAHAFFAIA